jgi:imidazolonepropionase-like amidohydrolase
MWQRTDSFQYAATTMGYRNSGGTPLGPAGVDSIEHGFELDADIAAEMARR